MFGECGSIRKGENVQSHNQFSINLNHQKSRAKKLLKAIRQGDEALLESVKKHQTHPDELTVDNIQLADVQFSIARELGLPSWHKLKAHAEELEHHRQAIKAEEPALDSDMTTLHIRCGHDIQDRLKLSGFAGEFLPLIDPLCIGPIPSDDEKFITTRARYVAETLLPVMGNSGSAEEVSKTEREKHQTLLNGPFQRLVFWIEHDSYDQFMLLRALNLLESITDKVIEIIELSHFPGTERFIGMGQLPPEAVRSCWHNRRPVSAKLMSQAKVTWNALKANSPESLVNLLRQGKLDCLPNLANVIERHLQELPNASTGLSLTQTLGLDVLQEQKEPISFRAWFQSYQKREPLPFLGDIMFYALMLPLTQLDKPLFTIDAPETSCFDQSFTITPEGVSCLSGQAKVSLAYWVGGIFLNQDNYWAWDHQDLNTVLSHKGSC